MARTKTASSLLNYSSLESRQLLAAVTLSEGVLNIVGTMGDDQVEIVDQADSENFQVIHEGNVNEYAKADVAQIEFRGRSGNDSLDISSNSLSAAYEQLESVKFYGGSGNDSFFIDADWSDVEVYARGSNGDDLLQVESESGMDGTSVTFLGGAGDDVLRGGSGNDLLNGQLGNDQIWGGAGDDNIFGADGNDILRGQQGNDQLYGGNGDDRLEGQQGNDQLRGFTGSDLLFGGIGDDLLNGGDGDDILNGHIGNDTLRGQNGNDRLIVAVPNTANDSLGSIDENFLHGGSGNDRLISGAGIDQIFGGPGSDTFINTLEDSIQFSDNEDVRQPGIVLDDFLGLTREAATELADSVGYPSRITIIDGEPLLVTFDFMPRRLNFVVVDNHITHVATDGGNHAGEGVDF